MIFRILLPFLFFSGYLCDEEETKIVYTRLNNKVKMECEGDNLSWKFKANESSIEFTDVVLDETTVVDGAKLTLKSLAEDELGVYACFDAEDNLVKQFDVVLAFRVKRLPASVSVDVGESTKKEFKCISVADNNVLFRWFKREEGDEEAALEPICGVENDNCMTAEEPQPAEVKDKKETTTAKPFAERISITPGEEDGFITSTLTIDNVQYEDRQVYVCHLISLEHKDTIDNFDCSSDFCDETESLLRVKDPLAALWPFVGIVAEVVILCVVIFICERRKKEEDKDDLDDDRYAGNNVSSNNSLRQRK